MATRKLKTNGVEVFDEDVGGWEIPTPTFALPNISVPNYYDGLRERSHTDPIALNRFVMASGHQLGLF